MAAHESPDWLVRLYEEQGSSLHRLVVLLGAEPQSGRIVRSALLALHRRGHRLIDPAERIEFLQEHTVHLARAVRVAQDRLTLPEVDDPRQNELLHAVSALPARTAEILVVSHYLSAFGPELAGIMRQSVRGCNQRLEAALEAVRARVGEPSPGSQPGVIESLSQELTAALRSAARTVQAPGTDTLLGELSELSGPYRRRVGPRTVVLLTVTALLLGLALALLTRPDSAPAAPTTETPSATANPGSTSSLPAQVQAVIYYVGRSDGRLYRELRGLPSSDNLVTSVIDAVLSLAPLDPDYRTAWGPGQLIGAEVDNGIIVVDLTAEAYSDIDTARGASQARNQVVYSLAHLLDQPDVRVRFLMDGGLPPESFRSTSGFQAQGLTPLTPVMITAPRNGARFDVGEVIVTGQVQPGAGVPFIRVTDIDSGAVIVDAEATVSSGVDAEGWHAWSTPVSLGAGNYDIRASVVMGDPSEVFAENKAIKVG
ncbi:MAG: GerMN domain-containing protein [Arachnia sp.]